MRSHQDLAAAKNKKEFGFSLVGILVGVSLLGILTLGMTQFFSSMLKNQNYTKFRTEIENFGEELRAQLGSESVCTATFSGILLNPAIPINKSTVKNGAGATLYSTNVDMGDHSFKIASMDLKSLGTTPWYSEDDASSGTGRMILTIAYRATTAQAGASDAYRTYTLATRRDATGKLVSCSALAKMTDGIWRYNTSTTSSIYYSGGNVGIGTTTPRVSLQVEGAVIGKESIPVVAAVVDFSSGNILHSSQSCTHFELHNLSDGGSYMFVVKGGAVATCSFTAYSDNGTIPLAVHLSPDHGPTTLNKHTIYNIAVSGNDVYIAWAPGF